MIFKALLVGLLLLHINNASAKTVIKVGIYDFPPYVFDSSSDSDKPTGITLQMITAMNKFQQKYEFVAIPTTSKRRYHDFENNKFDIMIFESKKWGWQKYPMSDSNTFATGAEVYVTQARVNRNQDFFNHIKDKTMITVLGYHYQFANFNTEQEYLDSHFNILQTNTQKKSLELILKDRGDIAVLSEEYLNYHFSQFPEDKAKLLISDKFDQIYQHTIFFPVFPYSDLII